MSVILIYHKDRKGHQFAYSPETNRGFHCAEDPLEYIEEYLSKSTNHNNYSDIYSYIRYVEFVNIYTPGTLYIDSPTSIQYYEYW